MTSQSERSSSIFSVLVADADCSYRGMLAAVVEGAARLRLADATGHAAAAVEAASALSPDVAVIELGLATARNAELLEGVARESPRTRVLLVADEAEPDLIRSLIASGAAGYLSKDAPEVAVAAAILTVAAGEAALSAAMLSELVSPGRAGGESTRAELFHSVFEHAPEALLLADDQRRYVAGNRTARSFLGVSREALLAKRIDDLASARTQARLEQLWRKFLSGQTMTGTFPIVLPNGLRRNVVFQARASVRPGRHLISFQPAPTGGRPSGLELGDLGAAARLTFREREILTHLARGSNAKAIAEAATLSPETVRTHVRNAMRKVGARTRPHAVAIAIASRQIDP